MSRFGPVRFNPNRFNPARFNPRRFSTITNAATEAPTVTASSYTNLTQSLSLTMGGAAQLPCTIYWATVTNPSTPTGAQIQAGTGGGILDAGNFAVGTAPDTDVVSVSNEAANEMHLYIVNDIGNTGNPSGVNNTIITGITVDDTAPGITSYSPADNATSVAIDSNLVIVFNESMDTSATTTVTLKVVGGATVETFDTSTDGTWSTTTNTNDTITLNPASDLTNEENYAVQYSGFKDLYGNTVTAVSDDTTWNFQAASSYTAPDTVTFTSSDYVDTTADLDLFDDEFVLAFKYTVTNITVNEEICNSGGTGDSRIFVFGSNDDKLYINIEDGSGAKPFSYASAAVSNGETYAVVVRGYDGDSSIWVNGTEVVANDATAHHASGLKCPIRQINNTDGLGAGAQALTLQGFWYSNAAGVANPTTGLSNSDFFDGSNNPTWSSGSIGGFAPNIDFFTLADWNNYAGTTGTLT